MFWKLVTVLLSLQLSLPTEAVLEVVQTTKALQFGTTLDDFVKWYPDMTKVKNGLTICAWIKKRVTAEPGFLTGQVNTVTRSPYLTLDSTTTYTTIT